MSLGFAVLLWLHIVGAVGWLGAAMSFAMLIVPALRGVGAPARGELLVRLLPRYVRYVEVFAFVTPVFGLTLALYITRGNWVIFSPSTPFGLFISAGALLSLLMWGIVFGLVAPTARRVVSISREALKSPGAQPPRSLEAASRKLGTFSAAGLVVLLVIVACMVVAATS